MAYKEFKFWIKETAVSNGLFYIMMLFVTFLGYFITQFIATFLEAWGVLGYLHSFIRL